MSSNTVFESFYPFSLIAFAFAVEKVQKVDGTYQTSPWAIYIFIGNCILLVLSSILWHFNQDSSVLDRSDVYYWSMKTFIFATFLRFLSIHIFRLLNKNKEINLYTAIDDFDRKMVALGKGPAIAAAKKRVTRYGLAAIPASLTVHILSEVFTIAVGSTRFLVPIFFSRFLVSYVGILAKIQFYLWCTAITERFAMINDLLVKVKERFQLNNMFVVSVYKYEQSIEHYADLHRDLTNLARQMNQMYQFDMLWHFFIMFVVIFTNGYFSTYMMLHSNDESYSHFAMISNAFFIILEIILSIKSSTDLCNESYKALDIFNNLKVDPDDASTQRLVISSIFELKENRLEITACRFFNVNYSTLAVMATIITNYVFILLQFEDATGDTIDQTTAVSVTTQVNIAP